MCSQRIKIFKSILKQIFKLFHAIMMNAEKKYLLKNEMLTLVVFTKNDFVQYTNTFFKCALRILLT